MLGRLAGNLAGTAAGGALGTKAGTALGTTIGLAAGGPVGAMIGAPIGGAIGGFTGGAIGGDVGKEIVGKKRMAGEMLDPRILALNMPTIINPNTQMGGLGIADPNRHQVPSFLQDYVKY